jgi:pseudaminic acid biosynthesis-associated methylase
MSLWEGDFGDDYTKRNFYTNVYDRKAMFKQLLPRHVESLLEVGANTGANINAIACFRNIEMFATEPNERARRHIQLEPDHITGDYADHIQFPDGVADLAMTVGVLIHVPSNNLMPSMREIHRCSRRYILCGEYFAPNEEMVPYRGQNDALWRRDYGSLWLDAFPDLTCTQCTFAWKRTTGLDNLTFWLFEKGFWG